MANTTNLDLVKPAGTDKALVSVINANSDKIDAFAGSTNQAITTLNSNLTNYGITAVKSLTVTKNSSISTVIVNAYRIGQLIFVGGYFSHTSGIANGTTIATINVGSPMSPGNFAGVAVQSDDNSIKYLSFQLTQSGVVDMKISGNLGANQYCRFFMVLPYT